VKSNAAGKFKNVCLKTLDEVAATKSTVVITRDRRLSTRAKSVIAGDRNHAPKV
jgi:hypothetical protein